MRKGSSELLGFTEPLQATRSLISFSSHLSTHHKTIINVAGSLFFRTWEIVSGESGFCKRPSWCILTMRCSALLTFMFWFHICEVEAPYVDKGKIRHLFRKRFCFFWNSPWHFFTKKQPSPKGTGRGPLTGDIAQTVPKRCTTEHNDRDTGFEPYGLV